MYDKKFLIYVIIILISIHSSILINYCPDSPVCNCILSNDTDLEILCNATLSPSILPTLFNPALQINVTSIGVGSSFLGSPGPLITLPLNICSSYPNVARLDFSSNSITGFLNTSELACLGSNLLSVDFSNNFITDIDIDFFQANRKLQTINLAQNNLITMPAITGKYFVNFTSTITLMNFSYNQITNVDFWPLFVRTHNLMIIDMSYNLIENYTNKVPVYVKQMTEPPDPRNFFLNNNRLVYLSDLLFERYGACTTLSLTSTAFFIVGISNLLLTNNPLICDCQSYNLITFIYDHINDFPLILNGTALLTQTMCTSTTGQTYRLLSFTQWNNCVNYTLPSISDAFCSIYTNSSTSTLAPPTYWPTTTTIFTTIGPGNQTNTEPGGGGGGGSGGSSGSGNSSSSPAWYIVLGIVLGLVLIILLIALGIYLCRDRILTKKCRAKLGKQDNKPYELIQRASQLSKNRARVSISTSTCGINDSDNQILQFDADNDGKNSMNDHDSSTDKIYPNQQTQTCFQITRSKPSGGQSQPTRNPQRIFSRKISANARQTRKISSSTAATVATNTTNVVKGIPIAKIPPKNPLDISASDFSVKSIPSTASKRAKLLPQLKSGIYIDSTNNHSLLNTSASALITNQRQRRRSLVWMQKQNENLHTPLPPRSQSDTTKQNTFNQNDSSDDEQSVIPTVENLTNKTTKPLRALPLLNITVIPAWIDNNDDNTDQTN